jgi:hypothetical protein
MDSQEELWSIYQGILDPLYTWKDHCRPIILPESDPRLLEWEGSRDSFEDWMEVAKQVAVERYGRVLEDSPENVLFGEFGRI